jgi:RNA polymerase sigma-70 factor (ECF subfamily)
VRPNQAQPAPEDPQRRFEAIFASSYGRVLAYALRRSDDHAAAEEAAAETFVIAWRRLDAVPADPLPWLLQTTRRVLANQRRSARRRDPHGPSVPLSSVPDQDPAPSIADRLAERDAFAQSFSALRPADREVLALVAWDGLRPKEAAQVLGCSAAVFSLRLHRARRRLMKELAAHERCPSRPSIAEGAQAR